MAKFEHKDTEPFQADLSLDFGDYVIIEQKRYGCKNEMYHHKVINRMRSNCYVDVPTQTPAKNELHDEVVDVVSCICCGVMETEVLKYRVKDVRRVHSTVWETGEESQER